MSSDIYHVKFISALRLAARTRPTNEWLNSDGDICDDAPTLAVVDVFKYFFGGGGGGACGGGHGGWRDAAVVTVVVAVVAFSTFQAVDWPLSTHVTPLKNLFFFVHRCSVIHYQEHGYNRNNSLCKKNLAYVGIRTPEPGRYMHTEDCQDINYV